MNDLFSFAAHKQRPKSENMEGSLYGRVFGNEMMFLHSKTFTSHKNLANNWPTSWTQLLTDMAKKHSAAVTHSEQFMDVSLIVPTVAGLPLHIDVNGTGTVDLLLNGKMDLKKIMSSPRSFDIAGEIRPR